ncbi:MAG: branched-chain amino acid ABC transporter ATP-binding protein/permease [Candidatus Rokubacteria bacterium]|nr:branched-chain amino acid ABC transporter ATP-binding protein/permease [Candidatus Rokubacteria bacterium]
MSRARGLRRDLGLLAGLVVALALTPAVFSNPYYVNVMVVTGLNVVLVTGLNLILGWGGQISLGHAAFFGIGAYTSGILCLHYGLAPWAAMAVGVVLTMVVALVIGLPALRLRGYYFAMATLGVGIIVQILLEEWKDITGGASGLAGIPPLSLGGWTAGSDLHFFYVVWGLWALCQLAAIGLSWSVTGRSLRALRDDEVAAEVAGVDTFRQKLGVFVLGAAWASLSGSIYAHYMSFLDPPTFGAFPGVKLATMAVVGGMGSLWGPMVGGAALTVLPEYLRAYKEYDVILFGVVLGVVVMFLPDGLAGALGTLARRGSRTVAPAVPAPAGSVRAGTWSTGGGSLLEVSEVSKAFGGVRALAKVSFVVRPGTVTGVIGPNGAGKTTLFNVLNGLVPPDGGRITLDGAPLVGLPPHQITRRGIGRTFQSVRLFPQLPVLDNVAVALQLPWLSGLARGAVSAVVPLGQEAAMEARGRECLAMVGLAGLEGRRTADLSLDQQRRLELARALAPRPRVVLMDEPGAGLNDTELAAFGRLIRTIRAAGVSVVLIEHRMEFVMGICDTVVVLDHGTKIAEGSPEAVRGDPQVIVAYLGDETPLNLARR